MPGKEMGLIPEMSNLKKQNRFHEALNNKVFKLS